MSEPRYFLLRLDGGRQVDVVADDVVLRDRTCGQWDEGWVVWHEPTDEEWFLSETGDVYALGTSRVVGVCDLQAAEYARFCEVYG